MLDIPELDDMICLQLSQHDLAQCVRVSKNWHRISMPYLWRDMRLVGWNRQRAAFHRMVLDSYHHERQHKQEQVDGCDAENAQGRTSLPLSTLAKYGHLVQMLPDPDSLIEILRRSQQTSTEQNTSPTEQELLRHLYHHCPFIQLHNLDLTEWWYRSGNISEVIANYVAPRVHYVRIQGQFHEPLKSLELKYMLDRCSGNLKRLILDIRLSESSDKSFGTEEMQDEKEPMDRWPLLKALELSRCGTGSKKFQSWLWRRCGSVEALKVCFVSFLVVQSLVEGMLTYMPNLHEIRLGRCLQDDLDLHDDDVAAILSSSRKGWRKVEVKCGAEFQNEAMDSLAKHFHTLEEFCICNCKDITSINLALLLSSSPKLRHLEITQDDPDHEDDWFPVFKAKKFIDLDPSTGLLKTWLCESSLTVLKIFIDDIPRPDLRRWETEACPGEGRKIQGQVYDRLGRLTNLETLCLGLNIDYTWEVQTNCLEMSLESGLHKLSGLTKLKELDITNMMTRIGLREVQWMVKHWPNLRTIYGLEWDSDVCAYWEEHCCREEEENNNKEAVKWVREH